MATLRQLIVSVWAALLAASAAAAFAQPSRGDEPGAAALQVEAFDVEQVPALGPGTQLHFSLFGTPDAAASLQIEGARLGLELHEVQPGIYEGSYTIDAQDRIPPDGQVVATLRRGHRAAQAVLDEPLLLDGGPAARPAEPLEEHAPGAARPRIGTPVPMARNVPTAPTLPAAPACDDCAVVESIRAVDLGANPGYVGAVAGGLLGALLGDQLGRGDGRRLARIMGALGGAVAGRELERSGNRRTRYDVVLRLPGGAAQTRSYDRPPPFAVGDTVRLQTPPAAPF